MTEKSSWEIEDLDLLVRELSVPYNNDWGVRVRVVLQEKSVAPFVPEITVRFFTKNGERYGYAKTLRFEESVDFIRYVNRINRDNPAKSFSDLIGKLIKNSDLKDRDSVYRISPREYFGDVFDEKHPKVDDRN